MKSGILLMIFTLFGFSHGARQSYKILDCLKADVDAKVDVEIGGGSVQLSNTGVGSGYCNATASSLQIVLDRDAKLILNFEAQNGRSVLTNITVTFQNGNNTFTSSSYVDKDLSGTDAWYACYDPEVFKLEGDQTVTVTIESIQIQAFGLVNGNYSGKKKLCEAAVNTSSTLVPTTTEVAPTTTSHAPITTRSTKAVSTAVPRTSTAKPTPTTKPSEAKPIDVKVNTTHGVCILLDFTGTLSVLYVNKTGVNHTYIYPIDGLKEVSGACGNYSQVVQITLKNDWILAFIFTRTPNKKALRRLLADGTTYYMSSVELTYNQGDLPGNKNTGKKTVFSNSTDRFQTDVGTGYTCKSEDVITMGGASLSTIDLKAEAFRNSKTATFADNPKICAADDNSPSNIVPIVVGVVLALLVLVIIIAYWIGRRRNQSGYQSV